MDGYMGALELTVIALGALLLISFCFMLLTRALQWMAAFGKGGGGIAGVTYEESTAPEAPAAPTIGGEGMIAAPMQGRVLTIRVGVGDTVRSGDVLIMLESWEMLYEVSATSDGRVKEVFVADGAYVKKGEPLIAIGG
jgi:acetyl/propionyl-CoA carboxylase alpha subunit